MGSQLGAVVELGVLISRNTEGEGVESYLIVS